MAPSANLSGLSMAPGRLAWQVDKTRQGKARQDKTRQDKTREEKRREERRREEKKREEKTKGRQRQRQGQRQSEDKDRQRHDKAKARQRQDIDDQEKATTNPQDNRTRATRSRRIDEGGDEPQLTVYRRCQVMVGQNLTISIEIW